jgi:nitroreductase
MILNLLLTPLSCEIFICTCNLLFSNFNIVIVVSMELFEALNNRRSIRKYRRAPIPEDHLTRILEAAIQAPSAGNLQPWRFVVIRDTRRKIAIAEAALRQSMIAEAPVVIVVCADQQRSKRYYGERGVNLFCIQDTSAAVQNLMLAAFALGLGTCWVGSFDEKKVSSILHAPDGVRPVAIIPVGYTTDHPAPTPRRSLSEIVQEENF